MLVSRQGEHGSCGPHHQAEAAWIGRQQEQRGLWLLGMIGCEIHRAISQTRNDSSIRDSCTLTYHRAPSGM